MSRDVDAFCAVTRLAVESYVNADSEVIEEPLKKVTPFVACVFALVPPLLMASTPVVSVREIFIVDVAFHTGRPVTYELVRNPPVDDASVESVVPPLPYMSEPSVTPVRPVPPLLTVRAFASVSTPET